jgi:hypothetical protein
MNSSFNRARRPAVSVTALLNRGIAYTALSAARDFLAGHPSVAFWVRDLVINVLLLV